MLVGWLIRKKLHANADPAHYPAPYAILNNWVKIGVSEQALPLETESITQLFLTNTSKNLVRVFFLQEMLKGFSKQTTSSVKQVHVIGAGTMGRDIAIWCAFKGLTVTLHDQSQVPLMQAFKEAKQFFKKRATDRYEEQRMIDRFILDQKGEGIAKADLIIEAIVEDRLVKQNLFKALEKKSKARCIISH